MADTQSASSEAFSSQPTDRSRSPNADDDPPPSPSLPTPSSQCSAKPKRRPTVTPRTFTRFFTPRSSLGRGKRIGASRQALREITSTVSNRKRLQQRKTPDRDAVQLFGDENDDVEGTPKKRKRKTPVSRDTTPGQSSPLKRIRIQSLDTLDDAEDGTTETDVDLTDDESEKETRVHRRISEMRNPIESRLRGRLGWNLRKETGRIDGPRLARDVSFGVGTSALIIRADS